VFGLDSVSRGTGARSVVFGLDSVSRGTGARTRRAGALRCDDDWWQEERELVGPLPVRGRGRSLSGVVAASAGGGLP
jgi:hypothetical protein